MRRPDRSRRFVLPVLFACCMGPTAVGADVPEELRVKRQAVFEFTRKPVVTRDGDAFTIAFTAKAFCDVTVAVENASGRIVRHLASGVLGGNAPAPFQRNALEQTVVWDGKDGSGHAVGSGIYFYRLKTDDFNATKRMTLLK